MCVCATCAVPVGDVNLFFHDSEDPHCAELMIMIAEPAYRRMGLAQEAVKLMMRYGAAPLALPPPCPRPPLIHPPSLAGLDHCGVASFVAKISDDNAASLAMFTSKLRFVEWAKEPDFEETHLRWEGDEANLAWLREVTPSYTEGVFEHPPPPA